MATTEPHAQPDYDDTIRYDQTAQAHVRPKGRYHSDQIVAHWTIVGLVILQYLTGPSMSVAFETALEGGWRVSDGVSAVHGIIGLSILTAMVWRVFLRRRYGAPPPPETEPRPLQMVSRGVHYAFYGLLLGMPLFGLAAVLTGIEILGTLHGWAALALLLLAVAHVGGALMHAVKRDGVVTRILNRGSAPRGYEQRDGTPVERGPSG
jgi:cytochrome b561